MCAMVLFVVACSSSGVGESTSSVSYAGAQADWSQFPDGYQCLVGVQMFYPARFGASVPIAGEYWSGDCAPEGACHVWYDATPNASVWERIANDGSESPSTYDMIVFGPTSTNAYGHIASVDHVDDYGNVYVMDDNYNSDERKAWEPHTVSRAALGWYHLRSLPKDGGGGGGGSSSTCPNNGLYCGGDYVQGDPATLYQCSAHALSVYEACSNTCVVEPNGYNDYCE
jgi:hypothetical protein